MVVNSTGTSSTSTSRRPTSTVTGPACTTSGARAAVGASEHRLHPGHQLGGRERLGEVVVAAELEPEHAVDLAVAGGEEDHRDVRGLAQSAAHLEAVDVGETDVEHDEARVVGAHRLEPRLARRRLEDAVAVAGQVQVDEIGDVGLVVDHDDGPSFHGRNRRTWPAGNV